MICTTPTSATPTASTSAIPVRRRAPAPHQSRRRRGTGDQRRRLRVRRRQPRRPALRGAKPIDEDPVLQGRSALHAAREVQPAYPYNVVMMKHAPYIATEKSVKATRPGRTGGRSARGRLPGELALRLSSSITRNWHMPMHQTDTLFHKKKVYMGFLFGGETDNHAINTVPKETLVRIVKAEDGGLGGGGLAAWRRPASPRATRTRPCASYIKRRPDEGGVTMPRNEPDPTMPHDPPTGVECPRIETDEDVEEMAQRLHRGVRAWASTGPRLDVHVSQPASTPGPHGLRVARDADSGIDEGSHP